MTATPPSPSAADPGALALWPLSPAARALSAEELLPALARELEQRGTAIARATLGVHTMHPEVYIRSVEYTRERGVAVEDFALSVLQEGKYLDNPVAHMAKAGVDEVRDLLAAGQPPRFEVTQRLREQGLTDYVLLKLPGYHGAPSAMSFATTQTGGFSDDDLARLRSLVPSMAVVTELFGSERAKAGLLQTYLGRNAARRVEAGAFRRGTAETIHAAIWMCDLRGFTKRVDGSSIDDVLSDLDAYFGLAAEPIGEAGGEILKFIGDAVLGVFVFEDGGARAACQRAVAAAERALERAQTTNHERVAEGLMPLRFGIALHAGEVVYGNIGCTGRLDFTVIGRAVNEASRVEGLCKELGRELLLTDAFVAHLEDDDVGLCSLGQHELRGVSRSVELFAPDEPPASGAG